MSQRPRGRLWWYLRFRRAYKKHGVRVSRKNAWRDAMISRRAMPVDRQWTLGRSAGEGMNGGEGT